MILEKDLVPYETSNIPTGDWIVFSPHHDDETIGMGGSLILAKEKNIKITLVIVTDGSQGGNKAVREKETRKVAQKLGIKKVIFLRQNDRYIVINDTTIKNITQIIDTSNAKSVFFPSPMELHPDHRMTTELIWNALGKSKNKPNSYAYEITVQNQVNYIVDISGVMNKKKSLLKIYKSQLVQHDYVDFMVSMNRLRAYTLDKKVMYAEGFYAYGNAYTEDYHAHLNKKLKPYLKKEYIKKDVLLNAKKYNGENIDKTLTDTLVSAIIPCYNDGQYLHEAISSVADQTYNNIEIVIIDDCSTEKFTIDVLKELKNSGYKVIDLEKNSGPSVARNHGISEAKGKYILPLDADDKIASTYIEKAVEILENNVHVGVVYCEAEYFGLKTGKWDLPKYLFPEILISNMIFATAMYRKDDWKTVGGYNANMIHGNEDHDFWLSLMEINREVYCINEILFYYRIKSYSRTSSLLEGKINHSFKQLYENHLSLYRENIDFIYMELRDIIQKQVELDNERVRQLAGKEELVQVREKQIEGKDLKIKEIGEQLAGKEIFIEEIKYQLEDLKTISNQQNDTLDLNKIEMQSLKNELALIYTSNSWRYTRYARKLKLKFRGSKKLN